MAVARDGGVAGFPPPTLHEILERSAKGGRNRKWSEKLERDLVNKIEKSTLSIRGACIHLSKTDPLYQQFKPETLRKHYNECKRLRRGSKVGRKVG